MNYLYCTFWIFGRYMHHGSAAAGGLCLLFNGSHKMRCIQSPCKDGEWENSFCRVMAELLNYLFNWDGGKKISSRVWKSIYGSVWKCSGQKNSWGFFFLAWQLKRKKVLFHSVQTISQSAAQYAIVFQSLQLQSLLHVGLYL